MAIGDDFGLHEEQIDFKGAIKIAEPRKKYFKYYMNIKSLSIYETDSVNYMTHNPDFRELTFEQKSKLENAWETIPDNLKNYKGIQQNSTIHVLGNGPSLNSTIGLIKPNDVVIGVNAAFLAHHLDYWIGLDPLYVDDPPVRKAMKEFFLNNTETVKLLSKMAWYDYDVKTPNAILIGGSFNHKEEPDRLSWDHCSTHAALDLAIYLGGSKIFLHGVDYSDVNHFYDGSIQSDPNKKVWSDFYKHEAGFRKLSDYAKTKNIEVINCNKDSKLDVFPKYIWIIQNIAEKVLTPTISVPAIESHNEVSYDLESETLAISVDGVITVYPFKAIKGSNAKSLLNGLKMMKSIINGETKINLEAKQ